MSGSATQVSHTAVESIIFHESNLLTTFCNRTSRPCLVIISNRFLPAAPRFGAWFSLTRLVKAEIVSPNCGLFINTSVGNPTVLRERFLRNRRVLRLRRRCSIPEVFIKEPRVVFLCQTSPNLPNPEFQHPRFDSIAFSLPIMSGSSSQG